MVKNLNYRRHTQYLQFLTELEKCKTQAEADLRKEKFFSVDEFEFLRDFLPEQGSDGFSSYKTKLIHEIDRQTADFKFVFGKEFKPLQNLNKVGKAEYTIENFLEQAKNCKKPDEYEKLYQGQFDFRQAVIRQMNRETTALFLDPDSLPSVITENSAENNAALTKRVIQTGYNPFSVPGPQEVQERGMDYLREEIERIEDSYNEGFLSKESELGDYVGENDLPEEDFYTENEMIEVHDLETTPVQETPAWPPLSNDCEFFVGWDKMSEEERKAASEARRAAYIQKQSDLAEQGIKSQKELDEWLARHSSDDTTGASPFMKPYGENNLLNLLRVKQEFERTYPELAKKNKQKTESEISDETIGESEPFSRSESDYPENSCQIPQEEKPRTLQEAHQFFIEHAYESGTPVPTLGLRNYQTGHITPVQGYEFARTEDGGQTVVLSKMNAENERIFFRISNSSYKEAMANSQIIAKAPELTKEVVQRYYKTTELDEGNQRENTAENFWHNYKAGILAECNNKQEAIQFAQNLVRRMGGEERQKFFAMAKKYESIKDDNGRNLSYDKWILDHYEEATRGMAIKSKSIFRDYKDPNLNVLDAIKRNTEVFDREGTPIDQSIGMRVGDSIKLRLVIDSPTDRRGIKLPPTDFKVVSYSKDNNSVALISKDGKQKYIKPLDDFIAAARKLEKRQERKQRREDWENSMEI